MQMLPPLKPSPTLWGSPLSTCSEDETARSGSMRLLCITLTSIDHRNQWRPPRPLHPWTHNPTLRATV
jgi:hypothetical protein